MKILCSVLSDFDDEAEAFFLRRAGRPECVRESNMSGVTPDMTRNAVKNLLRQINDLDYRLDYLRDRTPVLPEFVSCTADPEKMLKPVRLDEYPEDGKCFIVDLENGSCVHNCFLSFRFVLNDEEKGTRVIGESHVMEMDLRLYPHALAMFHTGEYDEENDSLEFRFVGFISRGQPEAEIDGLRSRIEELERKCLQPGI